MTLDQSSEPSHFFDVPGLDQTTRDLMEASRRFNRLQMTQGHRHFDQDLRPNELFLLGKLYKSDTGQGVKPSRLAELLGVTPGNITQLITNLEQRAWVLRRTDPEDRRAIRLSLTDTGREKLIQVRGSVTATFSGLSQAMGNENCRELARLLNLASTYLESPEEKPTC